MVDLAALCPLADVVLVAATPLDRRFPGGFAPRHASFASAVAQRHRTELVYIHDGDDAALLKASPPTGLANIHVLGGRPGSAWSDLRIPRQSVARTMRCSVGTRGPLVVTLTPSVAHVGLSHARTMAVLEEGWERLLPPPGRSPGQRALNAAEWFRYRSMYRRIGKVAFRIVAITPREREHFAQFIPEDRISVVTFGVDTEHFAPMPAPERDVDVLVVGAVNRASQKVEDLVNHLRHYPGTRSARCVVVGGSPRPSILELASPTVEVVGHVADVRPYYARAKVVVIPTFTAVGIKTTMLQAWAMERPVVTSQAVLDATGHGGFQASLAVPTVEQMGPVVAKLLGDADERERLGRRARSVVLTHHEERRSAERFASLVDEVLSAVGRP